MGEGYPRSARLRRTADYREIDRVGGRVRTRNLVVRWRRTDGPARFGLTVSRKVGNAVTRNRVKRWLREAIRKQRGETRGVDVVFIARASAARAGLDAIAAEVAGSLAEVVHARREAR